MRRGLVLSFLVPILLIGVDAAAAGDPGRAQQWALDRIGESSVTGQGDGIVVAVVDSGIDVDHVDLRDHILPGHDFVDDDNDARDQFGHGTHVAGIIAASVGNGQGVQGVAPAAKLLPVRVLDEGGAGTSDDVVAGIRWAIAHGADVINLSIGEDTQAVFGADFASALREAWDAGVVPVVAAGNQYLLESGFADEPALVVAATTRDDAKPSYSSSVGSAKWGMAAPGGEQPALGEEGAILSTYWTEGRHDQYAYDCGTSMAAPHVAGAVAVLLGLGLSPQQAVDRLLATATDLGAAGRDDTFGAGRLNLAAAADGIDPANDAPAPAPEPEPSPSPTTSPAPAASPPPTVAPAGATSTTATGGGSSVTTVTTAAGDDEASDTSAPRAQVTTLPGTDEDDESKTAPAVVAGIALLGALTLAVLELRRSRG